MKCRLDDIMDTCKYVLNNAKYVGINYKNLDELVDNMDLSKIKFWLSSNPFNILDFNSCDIVNFLLVYHTLTYCFWGDPKWEVNSEYGNLDGSYAMMYVLLNNISIVNNFDICFKEFSELLKGNIEIPLLKERYKSLELMNKFLNEKGEDFYSLTKDLVSDQNLFNYIVDNFKSFDDQSTYMGKNIYFYKRAQLLTSDILHTRELKEGINVDYTHLVGCADYKIPQVLRCYGVLEFSPDLANLVDNKVIIPSNSEYEVEIRASVLFIIDYIANKLNNKIAKIDINDYFWILGQNKEKMVKPYHRTLTNHY